MKKVLAILILTLIPSVVAYAFPMENGSHDPAPVIHMCKDTAVMYGITVYYVVKNISKATLLAKAKQAFKDNNKMVDLASLFYDEIFALKPMSTKLMIPLADMQYQRCLKANHLEDVYINYELN